MGIKDLFSVLNKHSPAQVQEIDLGRLKGYKVAVDISIYLYRSVRACGPHRWLDQFISFVSDLKRFRIHPLFVFDGPNPPVEKQKEQARRRTNLAKQLERLEKAERWYAILMSDFVPAHREPSASAQAEVEELLKHSTFSHPVHYSDAVSLTNALRIKIETWTNQTVAITPAYGEKAKDVLTLLGLPYMTADGEAETVCAFLAVNRHVDAVLSDDSDLLAYGAPVLFSQMKHHPGTYKVTVRTVVHTDVCRALGLTPAEFKDLCVLLGCDYNCRAQMYGKKKPLNVGAVRAFALIQEHRRLENVEPFLVDASGLNYKRCRTLFTVPTDPSLAKLKFTYAQPIALQQFFDFLADNHCRLSHDYIKSLWTSAVSFPPSSPPLLSSPPRLLAPAVE